MSAGICSCCKTDHSEPLVTLEIDCYRSTHDARAHLRLLDCGPDGVTLEHGLRSTSPGQIVTEIKVEDLVRCGCGTWQKATLPVQEGVIRLVRP